MKACVCTDKLIVYWLYCTCSRSRSACAAVSRGAGEAALIRAFVASWLCNAMFMLTDDRAYSAVTGLRGIRMPTEFVCLPQQPGK